MHYRCPQCSKLIEDKNSRLDQETTRPNCGHSFILGFEHSPQFDLPDKIEIQLTGPLNTSNIVVTVDYGEYRFPPILTKGGGWVILTKQMFIECEEEDLFERSDPSFFRYITVSVLPSKTLALIGESRKDKSWGPTPLEKRFHPNLGSIVGAYKSNRNDLVENNSIEIDLENCEKEVFVKLEV